MFMTQHIYLFVVGGGESKRNNYKVILITAGKQSNSDAVCSVFELLATADRAENIYRPMEDNMTGNWPKDTHSST